MFTDKEKDIHKKGQPQEAVPEKIVEPKINTKKTNVTKINKNKVIKVGNEFKYEEIREDKSTNQDYEKGKRLKEDQLFKSTHSGDIIIEANVTNKFKSNNRTYNTIKIASKVNRTGIRVAKIKNIDFNRMEIKLNKGM